MSKALNKKLDIVFANSDEKRYIPLAHPDRSPGSMGWLVYDQRLKTYLTENQVLKISDDDLRNDTERMQ